MLFSGALVWWLKLAVFFVTARQSFKALKQPQSRARRVPVKQTDGKTLSSTDRTRRRAIKVQLTTWVVWAAFVGVEKISDRTIAWVLPFYNEFKMLALLFILAWRSAGSDLIFRKIIKPAVSPYERPLDAVGFVLGEVIDILSWLLLLGPRWIGRRLRGSLEPGVPNIMTSLRAPGRPPVARKLATALEHIQVRVNPVEPARPTSSTSSGAPPPKSSHNPRRAPPHVAASHASTSIPFRPTLQKPRSRESLRPPHAPIAGPSRVPIPVEKDSRTSRLERPASLYPSLPPLSTAPRHLPPPSQPLRKIPSSASLNKGKGRADADDVFSLPSPRDPLPSPSSATTTFSIPSPPHLHPPTSPHATGPSTTPSRPPSSPSLISDTPVPPGSFISRSASRPRSSLKPLRNPIADDDDPPPLPGGVEALRARETGGADVVPPSPKQLARNAILDLAGEVEFDFGKRGKGSLGLGGVGVGVGVGGKRKGVRTASEEGLGGREGVGKKARTDAKGKGKVAKRVENDEDEESEDEEDGGGDSDEWAPPPDVKGKGKARRIAETTSSARAPPTRALTSTTSAKPRPHPPAPANVRSSKRKVSQVVDPDDDDDDGTETATEDLAALSSTSSNSTSSRRRPRPAKKSSTAPNSSSTAKLGRARAATALGRRPLSAASTASSSSHLLGQSTSGAAAPVRKASRVAVPATSTATSGTTRVASKVPIHRLAGTMGAGAGVAGERPRPKKVRRVLGTGEAVSDREEDGVPVVFRRRAA